eukprot:CAMPEP_0203762000 /NCGR_PEP_ID=MMETSP0098-20131031/14973_1 /ASSEMBLY_ACC=CAM_ASM_000208 /TAXON_ID=96639 /ORGANISM=" , Strain NY0313808BC1" /LENGTH=186 /DNA_ID=CAMNT_0050656227 /DNA_START=292 /DNA_END=852 /DNA_ORIENTATION=+
MTGKDDMLSAAELLLSAASPMIKPQNRDRSWSTQSLETLVDVATRPSFSLGPSANVPKTESKTKVRPSKKIVTKSNIVRGRSLLQQPETKIRVVYSGKPASSVLQFPVFPSVLAPKYKSVYFKDGRVGVYNANERGNIINKFVQKRNRRVWSKKVRYTCRMNLAQQRIRIKGRFVKTTEPLKAGAA